MNEKENNKNPHSSKKKSWKKIFSSAKKQHRDDNNLTTPNNFDQRSFRTVESISDFRILNLDDDTSSSQQLSQPTTQQQHQQQFTPRSQLDLLSDEQIGAIFNWLDLQSVISIGRTCKRLQKISNSPWIWRGFFENYCEMSMLVVIFIIFLCLCFFKCYLFFKFLFKRLRKG